MKLIPILTFFGLVATINAYPSVKGVPNQVSDVKGLKGVPPSPGHYDRPSKVGQVRDDVKGVKTVPVVQQHQQQPQQVQDDIKGVPQQRDPVKGVQQRDPVKGIAQHPIKGQHPVVSQRRPYQPVKGYPQQKEDGFKGGKSLVQQPQQYPEAKGVPQRPQRPQYPVKGYPHSTQQQVNDDVQQRQQPVFPVKGQRKTRSVNYEQDFDQTKVGQGIKGRKGGIKSVPKSPTKNIPRVKGKSVDDVKVVQQQQEAKVADAQVKSDELVSITQEAVPVITKKSQEKVAQEPAVVQEKVVTQQAVPQEVSQEKVVVQEAVKVPQEPVKGVPEVVKSEQVKDVQVKGLDESVQIKDEAVKGQTIDHVVVAVANGVGSGVDGASATASASAVVVVARDEPQVKEETKAIKSDEPKQGRHLSKVGSPVKGVPFYRKKITQQKDNTPVQQQEQQVVQQDQTVQSD